MKIMRNIFIFIILIMSLSACVFAVGALAGATAIAVVYDHRTIANVLADTKIANKIYGKFRMYPALRLESHLEVAVFHRIVLLVGQTPTPQLKRQAYEIAVMVPGIKRIYNQITVQGPTSSLTRTSDTWITAKIKSEMLTTDNLRRSSIKVLTENGAVYLMGIVTPEQAEIAVDIARQVSGVQKVIKIFQYKRD